MRSSELPASSVDAQHEREPSTAGCVSAVADAAAFTDMMCLCDETVQKLTEPEDFADCTTACSD